VPILLICLFASYGHASDEIAEIVTEGNVQIEKEAILNVLKSQKGYLLSKTQVAQDIRTLYETGFFKHVAFYYDQAQKKLLIRVQEKPKVIKILIEGNDQLKKRELEKHIEVKPYTFFNQKQVQEDLAKFKQFYKSKGFYLADVSYRLVERKNNQVELIYSVKENRKIFVQNIRFIGNHTFTDQQLKAVIRTKEKNVLSFMNRSGTYIKELLQYDRQAVQSFYGDKGFIKAAVQEPKVEIFADKQTLHVTFFVEEGDSYTFNGSDVAGDLIFDKDELTAKVKMKKGEVASTEKIRNDFQAIAGRYTDHGYAYANVVPDFQVDEDTKRVFVNYQVSPGPIVRVRDLVIKGNLANRDKVILREMELFEGELFNATSLKKSKQKLERLALFESVEISTPKTSDAALVDVVVEVVERETGSFNIGAGFNTLESFQVVGSLEKRSLFGYGVDINFRAQVGRITQIFDLSYRDPYFLDSKWGMALNAYNTRRQYTNFGLRSTGGSLGFDYPLLEDGLRRISAGVRYRLVNQRLSNLSPTIANLFDDGLTSSVTLSLSHDTRNNAFFATKGSMLKVSQEFAGTLLGGDYPFSKTELDARWYIPFARKKEIPIISKSHLAFRINTGYVAPLEDGARVPLFERYFPGGVFSVRGFRLRSLGPSISVASAGSVGTFSTSDFVIGGNKQFVFNAEYIFPLVGQAKIYGVAFFDMGNAFDNGENMFTLSGQRQSAGVELRWFSPLSPVAPFRFAWGFPLDRKVDEKLVQFDFTFGSLF